MAKSKRERAEARQKVRPKNTLKAAARRARTSGKKENDVSLQVSRAPGEIEKWRAAAKVKFLAKYREWGNIAAACDAAGIGRTTFYEWSDPKKKSPAYDPEFQAAVIECREAVIDGLEERMMQRAYDRSDLLLLFSVKKNRPERYEDAPQRVELTGADGGPVGYIDLKGELARKLEEIAGKRGADLITDKGVEVRTLKRA